MTLVSYTLVYDRNHIFSLGPDTETETGNWPKILADTETNQNHKILNWKALHQGVCKKISCHVNYQNIWPIPKLTKTIKSKIGKRYIHQGVCKKFLCQINYGLSIDYTYFKLGTPYLILIFLGTKYQKGK